MSKKNVVRGYQEGGFGSAVEQSAFQTMIRPPREPKEYLSDSSRERFEELERQRRQVQMRILDIFLRSDEEFLQQALNQGALNRFDSDTIAELRDLMKAQDVVARGVYTEGTPAPDVSVTGPGEGLMTVNPEEEAPQAARRATTWSTRAVEEARARGESLGTSRGSAAVFAASDRNQEGVGDGSKEFVAAYENAGKPTVDLRAAYTPTIPANLEGAPVEEYEAAKAFLDSHEFGSYSKDRLRAVIDAINTAQEKLNRPDRFGTAASLSMDEGGIVRRATSMGSQGYGIDPMTAYKIMFMGGPGAGVGRLGYNIGNRIGNAFRDADVAAKLRKGAAEYNAKQVDPAEKAYGHMSEEELQAEIDYANSLPEGRRDLILNAINRIRQQRSESQGMDEGGLMRPANRPNLDRLASERMVQERSDEFNRPLANAPKEKQEMFGRALADFVPGVGDVAGIMEAVETVRDPEASTVAKAAAIGLASMGLAPVVGDAIAAPARAAMRQADIDRIASLKPDAPKVSEAAPEPKPEPKPSQGIMERPQAEAAPTRRFSGEIDKDELEYLTDEWSRGNLSNNEFRAQARELGVIVKGKSLKPDAEVEDIIFDLPDGRVVRGLDRI